MQGLELDGWSTAACSMESLGGMGGVLLVFEAAIDRLISSVEITADRGQWTAT